MKLAIVTTHPIQYYAPLFKRLADREIIKIKVYYTWGNVGTLKHDPGFGKEIAWDIPLLEGYDYEFVENISKKPGSDHFWGIVNPDLCSTIAAWKPDRILVFGWSYYSHLQILRHFKSKVPILFRGDSHLLDKRKGIKRVLRRIFLTCVYRYINLALYVGTNNHRYYLAHGLSESQLAFAHHAIDNTRFQQDIEGIEKEALEWRRKLNIPADAIVFLFAGKLEFKKNPALLIRCFQHDDFKSSHLILVGNGVMEQELKAKASAMTNVHFLDFQNQSKMPVIYRVANVFVLPSQGPNETWGLAINEAMACQRAILASDKVGCAIDLIKEGENGYVFLSDDLNDIRLKMKKIISEPDRIIKMGIRSSQIIEEWSLELLVTRIEQIVTSTTLHFL